MNTHRIEDQAQTGHGMDPDTGEDRATGPDHLTAADIALGLDCLLALSDAADKLSALLDTLQPIITSAAAAAIAQNMRKG